MGLHLEHECVCKSRSGTPPGLIPVSVFASRDRDGDHGAQQAPGAGGRHLHAGAEHHRRGEERGHGLGVCAVEQVAAQGPALLRPRWGGAAHEPAWQDGGTAQSLP